MGQEEQLLSRGGLVSYLFFISVILIIFAVAGWHIYRRSAFLADRRPAEGVSDSSPDAQVQVPTANLPENPPMDDVQIL